MFIWFLKEKGLVPNKLFDEKELKNIVKNFSKGNNYYNAILQNLFFATLNRPMNDRGWANDDESGAKSLYRYEDKFLISKEVSKKLFEDIPYVNGGLFDCLDKEDIYIDGFSRNEKKRAKISDELFFGEEKTVDLYKYGLSKNAKVRGLIDILKSYNFTTDEATPIDQEIALDPEMLGKVFENLLASYNPETNTTARKSTGSYYTPREIVDYMVEESLKEYLKAKVPEAENILDDLFSYSDEEPNISNDLKEKLIQAIDQVKIIDPACGSGAFPMGILHKLVFLLQKLDPENEIWRELQLEKASKEADAVFRSEKDKEEREKLLEEINDNFDESMNYPDYARKLYLIENCIYGVDIQPIAIQISKLRFFISLILDQKVDRDKPNFGILTLPNLETKFVSANALIGLEKPSHTVGYLTNVEKTQKLNDLKDELKMLKHMYFRAKDNKTKIQNEIKEIMEKMSGLLITNGWNDEVVEKIANFDIFDQNASADWFDPEWMFGVVNGFDIVIGNPPYIGEKGHRNIFEKVKNSNLGKFYQGKMDLFYFFFHLALNLSKEGGIISFITTNYYLTATGAKKLREDFYKRAIIKKLINFNELKIFESASGQHNMITILQKGNNENAFADTCITKRRGIVKPEILKQIFSREDKETQYYKVLQKDLYDGSEYYIRISGVSNLSDDPIQRILEKIRMPGVLLGNVCNVNQGIVTGADKVSKKHIEKYRINANVGDGIFVLSDEEVERLNLTEKEKEILKPWFKNSDIYRWITNNITYENVIYADKKIKNLEGNKLKNYLMNFKKILDNSTDNSPYLHRPRDINFDDPKIVAPQRSPRNTFGYNEIPWYASADVYFITQKNPLISLKYVLALLNSKLYYLWFYYRGKRKGENLELYQKPLSEVPIKRISTEEQKPFIDIVDKILSLKKQNPDADTSEYEKQIDQLVYQLYNLTDEEIKIIENSQKPWIRN
jgi:hypothetical protein